MGRIMCFQVLCELLGVEPMVSLSCLLQHASEDARRSSCPGFNPSKSVSLRGPHREEPSLEPSFLPFAHCYHGTREVCFRDLVHRDALGVGPLQCLRLIETHQREVGDLGVAIEAMWQGSKKNHWLARWDMERSSPLRSVIFPDLPQVLIFQARMMMWILFLALIIP